MDLEIKEGPFQTLQSNNGFWSRWKSGHVPLGSLLGWPEKRPLFVRTVFIPSEATNLRS